MSTQMRVAALERSERFKKLLSFQLWSAPPRLARESSLTAAWACESSCGGEAGSGSWSECCGYDTRYAGEDGSYLSGSCSLLLQSVNKLLASSRSGVRL